LKCPKCKGDTIFPDGLMGEKTCSNCGLVLEQIGVSRSFCSFSPEWPSNWTREDSETLKEWLTELRMVSCQLNLPNFPYREEAAQTIRKQKNLFFRSKRFGKNKRETIAALMHLILLEYGKERAIQNICKQLSLSNKLVMRQAWTLKENFQAKEQILRIQRKTSHDYLFEFAGKLTNNQNLILTAEEILTRVRKKGGNPISLAAGAFYYACKSEKTRITKETISNAFYISHRTVDTNERKIRRLILCTPAR
jgi:transcription initiation factor TFIIIB Brf1 subunit/transcription initiation factor TFIIB